jgi:hypothetical protein
MTKVALKAPNVFISYSHDSEEHKMWVASLATKLMQNGVDVILDQWDLRPGGDVLKFMETGVASADRVLMICTERYVRKADEAKGGVGYETMVVSGDLVVDLGTFKFIPIIRQSSKPVIRPRSVCTRLYIDMSDEDDFDERFDLLIHELHNVLKSKKPPVGKNPFTASPPRPDCQEILDSLKEAQILAEKEPFFNEESTSQQEKTLRTLRRILTNMHDIDISATKLLMDKLNMKYANTTQLKKSWIRFVNRASPVELENILNILEYYLAKSPTYDSIKRYRGVIIKS